MLCYESKLHMVNVRSERHLRVQLGTFKLIRLCICFDKKELRYDILRNVLLRTKQQKSIQRLII